MTKKAKAYNSSNAMHLLIIALCFMVFSLITSSPVQAQFKKQSAAQKNANTFYADIVWFQSQIPDSARLDVFTMIPYQALQFLPAQKGFQSQYSMFITIRDTTGKKVGEKTINRNVSAQTYEQSRGANAEFDYTQQTFTVGKGFYTVFITLRDQSGKSEFQQVLTISIPNFLEQSPSISTYGMSSLLYCSSIEEHSNGKTTVTPHLSTNVADLTDGFFVFFELYHKGTLTDDIISIAYSITDEDGEDTLLKSATVQYNAGRANTQQIYIPIKQVSTLKPGTYKLNVIAREIKKKDSLGKIIAQTVKKLTIEKTVSRLVYQNLDKAIRQLRFVATQAEIDKIQEGSDEENKKLLFEEYWKALDPTPATSRNEAFEEYYGRIDYANANFRSYTEGWMTDMGMVYIIFGQPIQTDKTPRASDGRSYARWIYADQRQFTFVDNSGFDDFRLTTPFPSGMKYRYRGTQ